MALAFSVELVKTCSNKCMTLSGSQGENVSFFGFEVLDVFAGSRHVIRCAEVCLPCQRERCEAA